MAEEKKKGKKPAAPKKKLDRDSKITLILSAVLLALTITGLILFFVLPNPEPAPQVPVVTDIPEPEPIVYPAPAYDFTEEHVYIEIPGIDQEYTIAWVSDLHMITDREAGDVSEGSLETVMTRYETLSISPDGFHGKELWPEIINYLNYNDFDAVIFGGDILDYCSTSNMEVLKAEYDRLKYPQESILYLRADHDYGTWYSDGSTGFNDYVAHDLHAELDGDDNTRKYLDFGDFIIAGVNSSIKAPGAEQMEVLTELYSRGVPVIAATHVPYYSQVDPTLEELSMLVRNKIYYWGPGSESYTPDPNMWEYLNMLYDEDSNCTFVLAGHLHAAWEGELREGLTQHIFSPAFIGVIGVVHIVPEGYVIE